MAEAGPDLFLSYKAEDRPRLTPLVAALEAEGFTLWWDAHIGGGSNWRRDIETNLDSARCVLVAWSKRSVGPEGEFVRDEAQRARRRNAYLPILIDRVEPPLGFGEVQALSLAGWRGGPSDPRFRRLADAIRARIGEDAHTGWAADPAKRGRGDFSRRGAIAAGAAATAALALGAWRWRPQSAATAQRLAVLPFANLSGDPGQLYFSEGISEEIRGALARAGVDVIGRDSTEAVKDLPAAEAGRKLQVAHLLTGSVRATPNIIRVAAQLLRASDGVEIWSQSYDRQPGDAIRIQTDIAEAVAAALSVTLAPARRAKMMLGGTADEEALRLFLEARQLLRTDSSPPGITRARALIDQAIGRDPRFARAFVTKAELLSAWASNYVFTPDEVKETFDEAEAAAGQALRLSPQLGVAEAILADVKAKTLDLNGALQHAEAALAMTIDGADTLWPVISTLAYTVDPQRALGLTRRAISLDPLGGRGFAARAEVLNIMRRYPEALTSARKAVALAPKLLAARYQGAIALTMTGHNAEANALMSVIPPHYTFRRLFVAIGAARSGNRRLAEQTLADMQAFDGDVSNYQYAQIDAQLGDSARAFVALDRALAMRDPGLERLKTDPLLDPLRADQRFDALLNKLRFPRG